MEWITQAEAIDNEQEGHGKTQNTQQKTINPQIAWNICWGWQKC